MEVRETSNQTTDVAARCLVLHRNRDRVAVVLHNIKHGQLAVGGRVQRLPELALRRSSLTGGDVGDLIRMVHDVFKLSIVASDLGVRCGVMLEVAPCLCATHGL